MGMLWAAADPPEQPLPFSHKQHAGTLKLQCKMCHTNPNPGQMMNIVAASVITALMFLFGQYPLPTHHE